VRTIRLRGKQMTKDDLVSKDTALKMAIDFMETLTIDIGIKTWNEKHRKETINACKEALEQPAQEPVSDDEIMNIWLYCEGKVAGLNEAEFDCKFPVIFSRALLEFINAKQ